MKSAAEYADLRLIANGQAELASRCYHQAEMTARFGAEGCPNFANNDT
jgi:hypothetical protein